MTDQMPDDKSIPEGLDFLKLVWEQEDRCEERTDQQISQMGVKAPQCLENLGTVLSLLDRLASCFWGCRGGDHMIEYLSGRAYSLARASLRLLRFGLYDESLLATRSIGEVANILFLFANDQASFQDWKNASDKQRKDNYSPFKVRLKLEALGIPLPIDQRRYSSLSEIGAHVTPQTKPQNHNLFGIPTLGGYFQQAGVLIALNELAGSVGVVAACAGKLSELEEEHRTCIRDEAVKLLRSTGGVDIVQMPQIWSSLRTPPESDSPSAG